MSVDDLKRKWLAGQGFTGNVDDAYKAWLYDVLGELAVSDNVTILETILYRDVFECTSVALQDMKREHLLALGYTGSVDDMFKQAWASEDGIMPPVE